ncbi:IS3 family transposase [Actinomadura madurae]|uniref:IS3 family transposase n=1 Tax=Actinomadura madurae TaxID=1993 RepID=UPI002026F01B|nr:IS3 family transposase [Actinomadura madurae]URN07128.1 IS3 family transposase [Actinomadura madurae]URN08400.1 IS3 family transposase [Actinomadura madurae]URN09638.1 IS3 family transposase [Actinomadura madurae]
MGMKVYSEEFKADAVALYLSDPTRTYASVARDLGVNRETLRLWVRQARAGGQGGAEPSARRREAGGDSVASDAVLEQENRELRRKVRELEAERDILRRAAKYFGGRDELVSRFQFVDDHRTLFSIKRLCHVLGVSRSGYYRWRDGCAARAGRQAADQALAEEIRRIHAGQDGTYGSPRVTAELRDTGRRVNHKRVERVMRAFGIVGVHLRRKVRTTVPEPSHHKIPDLIKRDFTAPVANRRYVGDITYLPVGDGKFLYLATVIDLCSRRLAGWSIADHMRTELVIDALEAAARTRGGRLDGAIFHSDHGGQYGSADFAAACARLGVLQSMGAVGTSADNAAAEAFNATLKRETLQGSKRWNGPRQARLAVFRWVTRYNTTRRHSALGQTSPIHYEQQAIKVAHAA